MTSQNHGLALRMAELAQVIALRPIDDGLADVTKAAKELIPGVDIAGVLLVGTGGPTKRLRPHPISCSSSMICRWPLARGLACKPRWTRS